MLAALARHHIADYSIHYHPRLRLLVAHFKYTGADYAADMRGIAADPETQRWWALTDGMQESLVEGATGSGGAVPWWQVGLLCCRTSVRDRLHVHARICAGLGRGLQV